MLLNGFETPLHLKRKPSRLFLLCIVFLHFIAGFSLLQPLAVPNTIHGILWIMLCASAVYHVYYYQQKSHDSDSFWLWQAGVDWLQQTDDESRYQPVLTKTVSSHWFVLLTLCNENAKQQRLLILRDQLSPDCFRRLRVRLKMYHEDAANSKEDAV